MGKESTLNSFRKTCEYIRTGKSTCGKNKDQARKQVSKYFKKFNKQYVGIASR